MSTAASISALLRAFLGLTAVVFASAFVATTPPPVRDLTSRLLAADQRSRASETTTTTRKAGPNLSFSTKLVGSLDLAPLFEGVARHAATKRGKEAILGLVRQADNNSGGETLGGASRREAALAATNTYSMKRSSIQQPSEPLPKPIAILSIAQSAAEARDEYDLIREATLALNADKSRQTESGESNSDISLTLPPIYGGTSPWDTGAPVTTDDDEWLSLALAGYASSMDKESILQADKVVERLLGVRAWADFNSTIDSAPELSAIGRTINLNQLQVLHDEVSDTVELVRKRTISDPSGTKSFSFRLSGDKFPALGLLRQKEDEILADLDKSMQQLLRNKSFARKIQSASGGGRKRSEAFDLDGRLVVSAPKRIASDMGVIRGYSKKGGTCYVEPKSIVHRGDELAEIREEIAGIENQIMQHQIAAIAQAAPFIDRAIDAMARIDTIFARAAFGSTLNGIIPSVENLGIVDVKGFVHPVLALKQSSVSTDGKVVPIDLALSGDGGCRSLIISGPNGGGKTLALKSFGVVAVMNKVGVPIPTNNPNVGKGNGFDDSARVDYFREILVEVGDQQNVAGGESTLMARLNHMSEVIHRVTKPSQGEEMESADNGRISKMYPLILLDELGGGTDPEAGSAIARAVLEKMMECRTARIVATTHTPQLKTLSMDDERFNCASVLLERNASTHSGFKRVTFRLQYGIIGDSYALGAASRCEPALPDDVIKRASELMTGGNEESGDIFRAMTTSLEREQDAAKAATREAEVLAEEIMRCRGATVALARAYADHLSRLENRLENLFLDLKSDETRSAYDIVGDTLGELRHVKRKVLTQEELLAQRGLRMIPPSRELKEGENVVITAEGEWDGQSATVTKCENIGDYEVAVMPSLDWGWGLSEVEDFGFGSSPQEVIVLKRDQVALWDYPDEGDWGIVDNVPGAKSVSDSRQNLLDTLSKLTLEKSSKEGNDDASNPTQPKKAGSSKTFTSSRERKAANASAKKEKQRAKKKGKKKVQVYAVNKKS